MVIIGLKVLDAYIASEVERMGFEDETQMANVDILWGEKFGGTLPHNYYHPRDFRMLSDLPDVPLDDFPRSWRGLDN